MISSVGSSALEDTAAVVESAEGQDTAKEHSNVQKYTEAGVVSLQDSKDIGFVSNPENSVLLALFETARQRSLKLEMHRVDTQSGTYEFKIKSADERLNGAIVSLVMTTAGAALGLGVGFSCAKKAKINENSGLDNMGSLAGGAILQVFKSAGEVGEAAIGIDAAKYQAFADLFDQNHQAITSDLNNNRDNAAGVVSGMR